jgi:hypothetical protein
MAENTSKGGFGSMDDKQREISEKARKAGQEKGVSHEFTSEETRGKGKDVGEKGRQQMKDIGKQGGEGTNLNR